MSTKRPLTPAFINTLDEDLLKRDPVAWTSRFLLVFYYGISFTLLLALLCFIAPDDPRSNSIVYNWVTLLVIVSLLAFVGWMIYLLRFNVFKRFGRWKKTDTAKTFILYFLIVLLMVAWPFVPLIVQSVRANLAYSTEEMARDINAMNTRICRLERDSINRTFEDDTIQLTRTLPEDRPIAPVYDSAGRLLNPNYFHLDSASFFNRLDIADSSRQINDSVYIVYRCPTFQFVDNYAIGTESKVPVLSSMDLYRQVLRFKQSPDTALLTRELSTLFSKYKSPMENRYNYAYTDYSVTSPQSDIDRIRAKYEIDPVNSGLYNISERKYRWDARAVGWAWRTAYYCTLILSLLVLIYRHTTRRAFFLAVLTSVVLTILTGLFLATSASSDTSFFSWLIFYTILFGVITAFIFKSGRRHMITGIALNLLVFLTPFVPLIFTGAYYTWLEYQYRNDLNREAYNLASSHAEKHLFLAEIGGMVLLILMLFTLYQKAYRKWYASPEQ